MAFPIFTILAVIALGVSTWFLSSPSSPAGRRLGGRAAQLPGYYLKNAVLTDYDLNGASPSGSMPTASIRSITPPRWRCTTCASTISPREGQAWVLLGDTGHVESNGQIIDVAGNVRLEETSSDRAGTAVLHTDTLRYSVPDAIATTQSDVRIDFGVHTLTARGLRPI